MWRQTCGSGAAAGSGTDTFTRVELQLLICPITAQRKLAYENLPFRYLTKGAESEQPVGELFYQWVGCRDHAGLVCFPHSGSWQAQGGPVYKCSHQRKHVFQNRGPLYTILITVPGENPWSHCLYGRRKSIWEKKAKSIGNTVYVCNSEEIWL